MKTETAIDWLVACLPPQIESNKDYMMAIIKQAKKMEKEQIISSFDRGNLYGDSNKTALQHYDETYGN